MTSKKENYKAIQSLDSFLKKKKDRLSLLLWIWLFTPTNERFCVFLTWTISHSAPLNEGCWVDVTTPSVMPTIVMTTTIIMQSMFTLLICQLFQYIGLSFCASQYLSISLLLQQGHANGYTQIYDSNIAPLFVERNKDLDICNVLVALSHAEWIFNNILCQQWKGSTIDKTAIQRNSSSREEPFSDAGFLQVSPIVPNNGIIDLKHYH
ncbi:hypothetical protein RFI_01375 [Reticulomyxa filosa]|uniref:Uncharacterized protein n=1 Tax=Reticulomyxa filosa TaxID=46433 RepID=X6PDD6_RETFI|nr:hypothetical protein RFI_01375 [Reticulomyxa filosa]|eukprot:ETO35687.1 hypothetical protein RFI_01375 [Reticulomyxa filosa]